MSSSVVSSARAGKASFGKQVDAYLALSAKPKPLRLVYQTSPAWPYREHGDNDEQVDIGVLDSSFNPPQLAHFALSSTSKPEMRHPKRDAADAPKKHYDALLLLFSVRNADKGTGTSKDATAAQRLGMMQCLAQDLESDFGANVAVGIVEEPLMIAKSTLVHDYIKDLQKEKGASNTPARLHWLVGFDTLERFFKVKYYPSPEFFAEACKKYFEEEATTFICARRGADSLPSKEQDSSDAQKSQSDEEKALLESDEVKPWVERGFVVMMDLDPKVGSNSSTAIRKRVQSSVKDKVRDEELVERLSGMTTSSIAHFIVQEKLYTEA